MWAISRFTLNNLMYTDRRLPVHVQALTTSNYLYQKNLPEMSEMTLCFQLKVENPNDRRDHFLVSIARSGMLLTFFYFVLYLDNNFSTWVVWKLILKIFILLLSSPRLSSSDIWCVVKNLWHLPWLHNFHVTRKTLFG